MTAINRSTAMIHTDEGQIAFASAQTVARDFPHVVEIVVRLGGLGTKLDAMYDFSDRNGIQPQRGPGRLGLSRDVG